MKIIAVIVLLIGIVASDAAETQKCACGTSNIDKSRGRERIVGGTNARVNEFPMIGGIINEERPNTIFCGSTIITVRHAITAAHCYDGSLANLSIILGEHNIQSDKEAIVKISIEKFIRHEDFDLTGVTENDVAVLYLAKDIPFGPTITPACFPELGTAKSLVGQKVRVVGWGVLYENGPQPNVLQKVDLDVISMQKCEDHFGGTTQGQICTFTSKKDACQGDSGGPVMYMNPSTRRYSIVGIVSFGYGCAVPDVPAVSTSVDGYCDWILKKVAETDASATVCPNK